MTGIRDRITQWTTTNAEHIHVQFIADADGSPAISDDSYVRLWLAEGFLAKRNSWAKQYFPTLHGGVTLTFQGNEFTPFTRFTRPASAPSAPGAYLDYPMTTLIPYSGGPVEVDAALYRAAAGGPLDTAVTIAGGLASLIGPPLSTAASIAQKVATGLNTVLEANTAEPLLGVHWTMGSAGGGGQILRPGHIAVVNAPSNALPGPLEIVDGRLHASGGLLTGFDFLVLRVECRRETDSWNFPELERLRKEAMTAYHTGQVDHYKSLRTQAVAAVLNSPDLTETDRFRVATHVQQSIDRVTELGVAARIDETFTPIPAHELPTRDEVAHVKISDLLPG